MKNPDRVAELLAELRDLTENEFERHRLDVLQRDLTAPPVVEIIDDTHQRFNGFIYPVAKKKGNAQKYFQRNAPIHREVWSYHYGEIPAGYEIHHIDRNPENNAIENLQCISHATHIEIHRYSKRNVKHKKQKFICVNCAKEYEAALAGGHGNKYCSERCMYEYTQKAKGKSPYQVKIITQNCLFCGKPFTSYIAQNQKYCSHECSHAATKGVKKVEHPPKKCA